MPSLFFSYCHVDEELRDRLEKQFATLKRQGIIEAWHDRRIGAGDEIDKAIDARIETDDIILLLVSPDFINSDYCYDKEMMRAMERHERGEAIVIPVILRPCDWHPTPFGKLNAVPRDGKPITRWPDMDEAMLQVALAVREAANRLLPAATPRAAGISRTSPQPAVLSVIDSPRSSNLRVAKTFTQRDKDRFRAEAFEFLAKFFENSLAELGARNSDIEGVFERVDSGRFFATIYRGGAVASQATIYVGRDHWASGICYVIGQRTGDNSMNESVNVEADDQSLYLKGMGLLRSGTSAEQKLTFEGAAELFWDMLMEPLQSRRR